MEPLAPSAGATLLSGEGRNSQAPPAQGQDVPSPRKDGHLGIPGGPWDGAGAQSVQWQLGGIRSRLGWLRVVWTRWWAEVSPPCALQKPVMTHLS